MEQDLVGYVLNALDPDSHRKVEETLRDNPTGQKQLAQVRQALEPLAADNQEIEPPPGLALRALARVAEYCCRDLPRAPAPTIRWADSGRPRWWRRADVLVAASILLCIGLLIPPALSYLRHQHQLELCKENLGKFGTALTVYRDQHQGNFPNVAARELGRCQVAGMSLPVLLDSGVVKPEDISVRCPGNGPAVTCPWSVQRLKALPDDQFQAEAPRLSSCYAYSLGYRHKGTIQGLSRRSHGFAVPIMSDRPPFRDKDQDSNLSNSPNHGGQGQNVLFTDGHVEFLKDRLFRGDDIFLNQNNRVGAGVNPDDISLGMSEARP